MSKSAAPLAVNPSANLSAPCDEPYELQDDSMAEMGQAAMQNKAALIDCAGKHAKLVEALKSK